MKTAVITGASSGLGVELLRAAVELCPDIDTFWLIARRRERLEALAAQFPGKTLRPVPLDLTDLSAVRTLERLLEKEKPALSLLINNAGFGLRGTLLDTDIAELDEQDRVLTGAVRELSLAAARRMRARGRGGIINVSSLAAVTTMGQYAASKASTLVFTEALAGELRGSPVTVTAVLPGFIRTEFHSRLGVERPGPGLIWLSVDQVVRESLRDARAGKVVSVPGWGYRLAALVAPVVPRPLMRWGSTGFSFARTRDR